MFSFIFTLMIVILFFKALGFTFRVLDRLLGWLLGFIGISIAVALAFTLIGVLWKLLPVILVIGLICIATGTPRRAA